MIERNAVVPSLLLLLFVVDICNISLDICSHRYLFCFLFSFFLSFFLFFSFNISFGAKWLCNMIMLMEVIYLKDHLKSVSRYL